MNIEIIDAKERNIFLHLTADAYPVFFTQAYHEFEQSNGYETGFITSDHKVWMPFRIYKKLIFNFIQIMYPPLLAGERLTEAAEKKFLNACIEQLKKEKKYHRIIQPFVWDVFHAVPDSATYCPFGQLYTTLSDKTEEEIFNQFSPKYRNAIRKVLLNPDLVICKTHTTELQAFYDVYREVHEKQQVYFDTYSHFNNMQRALSPKHFILMNLYYNNTLEGGAVITYTKKEANYLYGGAKNPTLQNGSIKLLQFEIIKHLKAAGIQKYVWGGCRLSDVTGTKQQGMQEFKMRFGCQIKKGFLWKIDLNKSYCLLYDTIIALQHRMQGKKFKGDVIDYEKNRSIIIS
jgi:lipid II:glycine glycyltransferase (peptidoglycan interpeptide bridge formation enzyme)